MDIVLIRHTSVGVPKGTCYGWSDVPVADTFETEAGQYPDIFSYYLYSAAFHLENNNSQTCIYYRE